MAQSGYTPISTYYSATASSVPLAANLVAGELALNTNDGKLYYKNSSNVVTLLASSAGASGDVVGPASSTDNALARFDATTGKLIQNSVGILSDAGVLTGLTGITSSGPVTLSSLTSGRVTYAGTAGLLQDSAALTYDGTAVTINKNSSALPASPVGAGGMLLQLGNADAAQTSIVLDSFGNGLNLNFRRANGTNASKTGASGAIGQIRAYGYGSTAYSGFRGQISFTTEETWTDSAQGLRIDFSATPIGTTTSSVVASMTGTGLNSTAIGATTPSTGAFTTLSATGTISTFGDAAVNQSVVSKYQNSIGNTQFGINASNGNAVVYTSAGSTQIYGAGSIIATVSSTGLAVTGALSATLDATIYGVTVGRGAGAVSTNTAVGASALAANTTGDLNTAVGISALAANTSGRQCVAVGRNAAIKSNGDLNVAIGESALSENTSGTQNTGCGSRALASVVTGSYNSALGYLALYANTGSYNVGAGVGALYSNTTASNNTAVGYQAGYTNVSGTTNTFVGIYAGYTNTASNNTFIGGYTGYSNQGGNSNVAIGCAAPGGAGYFTFYANQSGNYNTVLGAAALRLNTSGSGNIAIGMYSLASSLTSDYNTAVGYQALSGTTGGTNTGIGFNSGAGITSGAKNVILGSYTGSAAPISATGSNYIVLSDGDGTVRQTIDSSGRVGINTTSQGTNPDRMYIFGSAADKYALHLNMQNAASSGAANLAAIKIDGTQGRGTSTYTGISIDISDIDVGACYGVNAKVTGAYSYQYAVYQEILKELGAYTNAYCNYATMATTGSGGAAYFYYGYDQNAAAVKFYVLQNGGIGNYSGNNVNLSDRREKTNFAPAGSYLEKICAIPVQTFNYLNQNMEGDSGLTLGVVAQDVQAVAPELVTESNWANKDDEPKMRLSIYQTDLQYALMKCIQEQQAIITALTTRITALENK